MDICEHDEYTGSEGSDSSDCDSDLDPSYSILEDTQTQLSNLSIKKKSKSRIGNDLDKERDPEEEGLKIIESGKLEKLKVEQCKAYLRKHGLRLTGNKDTLIHRIKEHQEILNVGGEQKYPVSSFVLNCKGDACMGDVVMFEQNIYEMYNIASRSAGGPPCGTRIVAGRIVKESYGAAKQQHTFTIEVLWSKGEKPLPPLYPLLIKGRNLYRLKTMRQRWEDEEERCNVLLEKHLRGYLARDARETRVQKKETRKKILEGNRALKKEKRNDNLFQLNSRSAAELGIEALQPGAFSNGVKMDNRPQQPAVKSQRTGSSVDTVNLGSRIQHLSANHLQSDSFVNPIVATSQYSQGPGFRVENRMITFQHEQPKQQGMNDKYYGVQCNLVNHSGGFQGFQQPSSDNLGSILSSFCIDQYSRTTWEKELSKVAHHNQPFTSTDIYHRQPLTSFNNYHCTSLPDRRYYQQKQLCKFYAQGRCKFGGNCKFLHDLREDSGPRKEERRYYHSRPER